MNTRGQLVWRNGELVTVDCESECQQITFASDGTSPARFGVDFVFASGPDRHVVLERDEDGHWHESHAFHNSSYQRGSLADPRFHGGHGMKTGDEESTR
jgi:hypothetical protein